jgi:hypothetical protein
MWGQTGVPRFSCVAHISEEPVNVPSVPRFRPQVSPRRFAAANPHFSTAFHSSNV